MLFAETDYRYEPHNVSVLLVRTENVLTMRLYTVCILVASALQDKGNTNKYAVILVMQDLA